MWCIFNQEISDFHLSTQGTVEAGSTKTVAISFHPPQSAVKDGIIIQANTNVRISYNYSKEHETKKNNSKWYNNYSYIKLKINVSLFTF